MSRSRLETTVALLVIGAGLVLTFVVGLFSYMNLTAPSLHPDPSGVTAVARAEPSRAWAAAAEDGRRIAREAVSAQNLPGLSVAVGVDNRIAWAEGFGNADLEQQTPVTPDTRFRIAQLSIPFTSAAAGLLFEQHRLDLDDEIQAAVPDFPKKPWPVTLRQLMAQVAGIRDDAGDEEPISVRCDRTADGLQRFADQALLFQPGTKFHLSSYGWILVSAAIEQAAEEPFFTFMRARIFEPLGMNATRPDVASEAIPDRATFYFPRFAGEPKYGPELTRTGDYSCFAGAAAFLSTPTDIARFALALDSGKLLQPATVAMLQTPQRLASGEQTGYGLGWKLETVSLAGRPARMAGHDTKPDFLGGTATLITFPEHGLVVAVATNISFADTHAVALRVADAFARQPTNSSGR